MSLALTNPIVTDIKAITSVAVIPILNRTHINGFAYKALKGKYCLSPFVMIEITTDGRVRLCGCNAWMPRTVGNLAEQSLIEILSSDAAQQIRKSIIDGTYLWCNEKICGVMANDGLHDINHVPENVRKLLDDPKKFNLPHHISIAGDDTCNLSCPSCRTHVIRPSASEMKFRKMLGRKISENLFSHVVDQPMTIHVSTSGEVFASELLLNLLESIDIKKMPNFRLCLQTNALLAQKNWHRIQHLESSIEFVTVSIDAATANTYELLRRGGKWKRLLASMEFLQSKKQQLGFEFRTRMVVQNQNWREIFSFYDFSRNYSVDRIEYARVTNWGTWTPQEFDYHNVFDPNHQHYREVQSEIDRIQTFSGVWCHGVT